MKFLCNTEFFHSGRRLYSPGVVYSDITAKVAEQLIAADETKPLGALSFFTPVDEEAANYVKKEKAKLPATAEQSGAGNANPAAPKQPTKAELVKKAKDLDIQGADRMNAEELKQVIEAAEKAKQPEQAGQSGGQG